MAPEDITLYKDPHFIAAVEDNLGRDPLDIALDKSVPNSREVATRVKYLRKARAKLPSYYNARCIIPGRAYEQSSGERAAFSKKYTGGLCIDLTCGLGVDSFALSHGFERVVAVEPDPVLAEIARHNFGLLGARNIEVVNTAAEDFVTDNPGIKADLIYADPDRRDPTGKRVAALPDCSPDIMRLLPRLNRIAGRIVVKLSPLFDVHEVFRVFGQRTRAIAVSDRGECKEVLAETGVDVAAPAVVARMLDGGEIEYPYPAGEGCTVPEVIPDIDSFVYLAVPDVSLVKAGQAQRYFSDRGWTMPSARGYAFGSSADSEIMGRIFRITGTEPYAPKKLKVRLKTEGVTSLNTMVRDFPDGTAAITRRLGIKEGGRLWAAFTVYGGRQYCIFLDPA